MKIKTFLPTIKSNKMLSMVYVQKNSIKRKLCSFRNVEIKYDSTEDPRGDIYVKRSKSKCDKNFTYELRIFTFLGSEIFEFIDSNLN